MAHKDRGFDVKRFAQNAVLAGGLAIGSFMGSGARPTPVEAQGQTHDMATNQCDNVPSGALVVGDAEIENGAKLYPYPQSGEFANMTWMNEPARVCFPFAGKWRSNADRAYAEEKMRDNLKFGGQGNRGANGTNVWHYPGNLPAGGEVRHTGTGARVGEACPEAILDKIIKPNAGQQNLHSLASFDGDGPVFVNGEQVYTPDNNRTTGQQVRNHGAADVRVEMLFGGDYECVADKADLGSRADNKQEISKSKLGFASIDEINVYPDGRVEVVKK